MFKYVFLAIVVILIAGCSSEVAKEEAVVKIPLDPATAQNPLVVEELVKVPVGGSSTFEVRFFNPNVATAVGFGEDLRDKATITCFGVEGSTVNMVLRAPAVAVDASEEVFLEVRLEDTSRSTKGKKYECTFQVYNREGDVFQKDFNVILS